MNKLLISVEPGFKFINSLFFSFCIYTSLLLIIFLVCFLECVCQIVVYDFKIILINEVYSIIVLFICFYYYFYCYCVTFICSCYSCFIFLQFTYNSVQNIFFIFKSFVVTIFSKCLIFIYTLNIFKYFAQLDIQWDLCRRDLIY